LGAARAAWTAPNREPGAGAQVEERLFMLKNVGTSDRVVRLVVAAGLAFVAFTPAVDGWMATSFYVIAAYLAITALIGMCLIYKLLDVNTHDQEASYYSGEDVFDGRGGD
jgi:hypothetical protein